MPFKYDKESDTLYVVLNPNTGETTEYVEGDFSVLVDDEGAIADIEISHASQFVALAIQAGVQIEAPGGVAVSAQAPVWEDVKSSMITAFKYDPMQGDLDVIFQRTGLYRYHNVPAHIVQGLREASSKGSYIRDWIIGQYD